jgi:hypothetical protein
MLFVSFFQERQIVFSKENKQKTFVSYVRLKAAPLEISGDFEPPERRLGDEELLKKHISVRFSADWARARPARSLSKSAQNKPSLPVGRQTIFRVSLPGQGN